jgi:hypothetical protein
MLAAVEVLLGSAASVGAADRLVPAVPVVAAALPVPVVPVPHELQLPVQVPREPQLRAPALPVLRQVPPDLLLNLLSIPLPQAVVESEVPVHLQGRRSFSAAMARSSPPTGKPTY